MNGGDGAADHARREASLAIGGFHLQLHLRTRPKRPSGFHECASRADVDDEETMTGTHPCADIACTAPRIPASIVFMTYGSWLRAQGSGALQIHPSALGVVVLENADASRCAEHSHGVLRAIAAVNVERS